LCRKCGEQARSRSRSLFAMIIDDIRAFLVREFFRDDSEESLSDEQPLVSSGLLDSVATLKLVLFLEEQFHVEIDSLDIVDGKLDTLKTIEALVLSKQSK
jgi:acyl carrier protein